MYADQDDHDLATPLLRDIANYTQHDDPSLIGNAALCLAMALRGALIESGGETLSLWYNQRRPDYLDTIEIYVNLIQEHSKSSVVLRFSFQGIKTIFTRDYERTSSEYDS